MAASALQQLRTKVCIVGRCEVTQRVSRRLTPRFSRRVAPLLSG